MVTDTITSVIPLDSWDVGFFLLTLAISVLIGIYFATKNNSLEDFMLGGRNQRLLPVSVSMMTSFASGLTLTGNSVEFYLHGSNYTLVTFGTLLVTPISAFILLPVFHRLECISIFNYLELRYNPWCKRIVSVIFMIQMTIYNAVVLYVPSMSLKSILNISEAISIGVVGGVCIVYCTLGGIKAVIWTDFFQAALMYISLLCICIFGTIEAGGFTNLMKINQESGRFSMENFYNLDLSTRHTIYTTIFGATIIQLYMSGANQIQVQRSLSLSSLRLAQWSQLLFAIFTIIVIILSSFAGLILFANYKDCDPYLSHQLEKRDATLIYYVATHLDYLVGLRGIFVAGVFAATLSTLSSFANSMSALLLEDFIKPAYSSHKNVELSEKAQTLLGKGISFLFGLACIGLTFFVGRIDGLLQAAYTLFSVLGAPFITAFLLGMLTRITNATGMLVGMLTGFLFGLYIQFYQNLYVPQIEPTMQISTSSCLAEFGINNSSIIHPAQTTFEKADPSLSNLFGLLYMSYLWVGTFSMVLTSSVALIVSLLTGGWNENVDNRYLVSWLHRDENKSSFEITKKGKSIKHEKLAAVVAVASNELRKTNSCPQATFTSSPHFLAL